MKAIEKYSCFLLLFLILFYGVTKNEKQTTLQKLLFCDNMQHYKIVEGIHSNVYYQKEKEYAELIGMENLTMLSHVFGGSNIYIPKEKELQKREKYKKILEEFTGENTKELAEKGCGISKNAIDWLGEL